MFTKSLLMAALASVAIAAPVAQRQDSNNNFVMIATHSGNSNVHLRSINANGQRFWLGKPSATYCPSESGVDCTNYSNSTTIVAVTPNTNSSLSMDDGAPGGQQGFVTSDGELGFTQAHSSSSPEGSLREPFFYTPQAAEGNVGNLEFNSGGFAACPSGTDDVYQIYASGVPGFTRTDCIGINIATSTYTGSPAWEYT